MIKQEFLESLKHYTADCEQQQAMWNEVERNYTSSDRHYHNLSHLNSMLMELKIHKEKFDHWDTIIFAVSYHDLIYNTLKSNNEELSAATAIKRLGNVSFPKDEINFCKQLILATKKHEPGDAQTNLFTDADLSILGVDSGTYEEYSKQIRREYSFYPDIVYNTGRKKFLIRFLEMDNIYKTKVFSEKYERTAKANMREELNKLTN